MAASRRWIVCVTDSSQQRAYFGPYRSLDRAEALQKQINTRLVSDDRELGAWASIEQLEPSPGVRAIVDWAQGYPE